MNAMEILAPVRIVDMKIQHSAIDIGDSPAKSMIQTVDLGYEASELEEHEKENEFSLAATMKVAASLVNDSNAEDVRAKASATVTIIVAAKRPGNESESIDIRQYLEINSVSMAYAHARSYIMNATAISPMGMLILPPILPDRLVRLHQDTDIR